MKNKTRKKITEERDNNNFLEEGKQKKELTKQSGEPSKPAEKVCQLGKSDLYLT